MYNRFDNRLYRVNGVLENPGSNLAETVVFIKTATVMYSLGHRLHTLYCGALGRLSLAPSVGR